MDGACLQGRPVAIQGDVLNQRAPRALRNPQRDAPTAIREGDALLVLFEVCPSRVSPHRRSVVLGCPALIGRRRPGIAPLRPGARSRGRERGPHGFKPLALVEAAGVVALFYHLPKRIDRPGLEQARVRAGAGRMARLAAIGGRGIVRPSAGRSIHEIRKACSVIFPPHARRK